MKNECVSGFRALDVMNLGKCKMKDTQAKTTEEFKSAFKNAMKILCHGGNREREKEGRERTNIRLN